MVELEKLVHRHVKLKEHLALIADNKKQILDAIAKQRWFRFKNTMTVIFDRDTNLVWVDSQTFPYGKDKNKVPYSAAGNYAEIREMLEGKNAHWLGNCLDWTIPTVDELWQLVEDKTFSLLKGGSRRIRWKNNWCTQSGCLDLDQESIAVSQDDAFVIPCSHAYVPRNPKSTLEIFIDNQLDPIFHDDRISELYHRLYNPSTYPIIRRPEAPPIEEFETSDLLNYIAELEEQLVKFKDQTQVKADRHQGIKYVRDEIRNFLDGYESEQADVIRDFSKIALDLDDVTKQMLSLKSQADKLSARIDRLNPGTNLN